ncbi:FAD/NAD(P)-binding domain-containing protein [Zopfia rhizophila CBS 207.26]|uniref:FAD/NAD(P)-binding domain-containing protein n=1 Tax=Zopfia rhizophila CBS 207.26 TaxID=1314779 RepID=A0A6A6DXQ0_9PEZI|nr:FAD/NAD(P)-binding domain-containing protein [Zopfia rhizophila CBS 207.26]
MATPNNNTQTNSETTQSLPIVVVGGGCVGLFLALLLTQSTIPNSIIVIEPNTPDTTDTRAMAHQPLIFPLFAKANLLPDLSAAGSFSSGLCFRKSVGKGSELIIGKQFKEGEKAQLLLPQWKFQEILMNKVKQSQKGEVKLGFSVQSFEQLEKSIKVTVTNKVSGKEERIEASYLIGADGAKSTTRNILGLSVAGETLNTQLVATDIKYDFKSHGFWDTNFIIDTQDYGLIGKINDHGLWRVSYGVDGDVTDEQIHAGLPQKLEKMLPGPRPLQYEVKRVAPYKAQQRCAETFWKGRVGLVGDAAHLTNPYAGLGLASGIADAASLAEALESVITRNAPSSVFDAWATARREKFLSVVDKPSRMAFKRVRDPDPDTLVDRDPLMKGIKAGMPVMPASLITEGKELDGFI